MGIGTVDGFKFFDGLWSDYIVVEAARIEGYVEYINNKQTKQEWQDSNPRPAVLETAALPD